MKVLVSLSGGMDSAVALGVAVQQGNEVMCVGFQYGSKHNPYENKAAEELAAHYRVPFQMIDLSHTIGQFLKSDLLKSGGEVPEGHYEESNMSRTVVPGRNIIFASILAGVAWSHGAERVVLGIHAGDHLIYPDCRPDFYYAMRQAVLFGTDGKVELLAPFLMLNKAQILREGILIGVPFVKTRTCYKDQSVACGRCGSCQERLGAFELNGIEDPLEYESRVLIPKTRS